MLIVSVDEPLVDPLPRYEGSSYQARNEELLAAVPFPPDPTLFDFIELNPQMVNSYVLIAVVAKLPVADRISDHPVGGRVALLQWFRGRLTDEIDRYPIGGSRAA